MTVEDFRQKLLGQLQAFLSAQLGHDCPPITGLERLGVGRSRENWIFELEGEPLILRQDPPGGLVDTDRSVEFAVLKALEPAALPTPRALWLDAAGTWMHRPSLVMHREPGSCEYDVVNGHRPEPVRRQLAERFCDLMAEVHQLPWEELGLGEALTDPGPAAAAAELRRWQAILRVQQLEAYPELDVVGSWLERRAPISDRTVLVHADFKPGNILLDGDAISSLLDWELAHLGDPLEDLGWVTQPLRVREHLIAGAWERADLVDHYRAVTGWDVDEQALHWWNVFAGYKTAVMQVTGLRAFLEGRSDDLYRPTRKVLGTLLDAVAGG